MTEFQGTLIILTIIGIIVLCHSITYHMDRPDVEKSRKNTEEELNEIKAALTKLTARQEKIRSELKIVKERQEQIKNDLILVKSKTENISNGMERR